MKPFSDKMEVNIYNINHKALLKNNSFNFEILTTSWGVQQTGSVSYGWANP